MRKAFVPLLFLAGLIFMTAPILIMRARYESTMGLVQKIFYFHMPPAMLMLLSAIFCGLISMLYLIKKRQVYD
jgi:heme exporter protein C